MENWLSSEEKEKNTQNKRGQIAHVAIFVTTLTRIKVLQKFYKKEKYRGGV